MGFDEACGGDTSRSNSRGVSRLFGLHEEGSWPPYCEWHGSLVMPRHTETGRRVNRQDAHASSIPGDTASAPSLVEPLSMASPLVTHLVCFV